MRRRPLHLLGLAVLLASCGGGKGETSATTTAAGPKKTVLAATLAPVKDAAGGGSVVLTIDPAASTACWKLSVRGVGKPLSAHVQRLAGGEPGEVVIPLGDRFSRSGCVLSPALALRKVRLAPRSYVVVVYTKQHLDGALSGPLRPRG